MLQTANIFKNLTVIELAGILAGPLVGSFFAELGARVIKVENPHTQGDPTRKWKLPKEVSGEYSAYYASANYGKEVLFADIKHAQEREKIHALIAQADIVICNFKKGSDVALQMDYATLSAGNPKLIYAAINGYGADSARAAFDVVLQAEAGFMYMNGTPQSGPLKFPVAIIDILAAHQLRSGILCALLQRNETKLGAAVQVSLFDAAVSALVNQASNYLMCNYIPQPMGSLHPNIAPYGETFACADGAYIVLAIGTDRQFATLCEILQAPELAQTQVFSSNALRLENRDLLQEKLALLFAQFSRDELMEKLHQNHVPAGAIRNLAEVFVDEKAQRMVHTQVWENDYIAKSIKQVAFQWESFGSK